MHLTIIVSIVLTEDGNDTSPQHIFHTKNWKTEQKAKTLVLTFVHPGV